MSEQQMQQQAQVVPIEKPSVAPKKMIGAFETVPVSDVTIEVGYVDKDGKRRDVIHQIGSDVRITDFVHSMKEKTRLVKDEDGNILGVEPTGEYELTLKVKFFKA